MEKFKKEQEKYTVIGKTLAKPKNYGRVTMSNNAQVVVLSTNIDPRNPSKDLRGLHIYTIDSDFMLRIWDVTSHKPNFFKTGESLFAPS